MIITKKYENFSVVRKTFIGNKILAFLFKRIALRIKKIEDENGVQHVLSNAYVTSLIPNKHYSESYDNLYNTYFSVMDDKELSILIDDFLTEFENYGRYTNFNLLRTYLFAFFIGGWTQMVEHIYKYRSENAGIFYIGSKNDPEYKIIAAIQNTFNEMSFSASVSPQFSDRILEMMGRVLIYLRKKKEIDPRRLLTSFTEKKRAQLVVKNKPRSIVISILEERRFARIAELFRELKGLGYSVILYSALPKRETLRGIKKYPELLECLLLDNDLIDLKEAKEILKMAGRDVNRFFKKIENSPELDKFRYRGVPLAKIAINDLRVVLVHRVMQAALNIHLVERCIKNYNICGFIGMDNSIATAIWMDQCAKKGIPTFFHFYNATVSPIIYRMLLDSYKPTAWILGGKRQLKYFTNCANTEQQNFIVSGDMFADTIVNCNKEQIKKKMKEQKSIPFDKKVAVLISCYIIADFTEAKKKTLFQTVAIAVKELGMELVIKAHPNEDLSVLEKQMKEWDVTASIFHNDNIRDVFLAGDIVCMYNSEAAQQAMLVGIPVLSLVTEEMVPVFDRNWNYYSSGAVCFVPLGNSPLEAIRNIVFDEEYRNELLEKASNYTKEVLGESDGNNAKRFANYVHVY
ncbi:MAG: hypothetical protein IBJ16_02095, partial [Chitinophagaceae bacterium]|nr:hypothetical protein [Chitinophagaceae bacterium]